MNPRVLLFLKSKGLTLEAIASVDGDVRRVEVDGDTLPWTVHYMLWVQRQWEEWAHRLGFSYRHGYRAWENALSAGHTAAEFDTWLAGRV